MADGLDVSELVRRTVQANAKLYKGWVDLSLEYFRGITEIFGGLPEASPVMEDVDSGAGVIVLEAEKGATAQAAFLVTNDLERNVSCELIASELTDPAGAVVRAKIDFVPAKLTLAPGEQRVVQVEIPIDGKLAAGVGYSGEITIKGMAGVSVPLVIRRQHQAEESASAPAAQDTTEVKRDVKPEVKTKKQASRSRPAAKKASRSKSPA